MNEAQRAKIDSNTAYSICNIIRYIWNYFKPIVDAFWLGIGKPIKHSYDFFRYIRSEVGTVVAICIRKCCRKGRDRAIKVLKSTRNNKKSDDDDDVIKHNARFYFGDYTINDNDNDHGKNEGVRYGGMELRHRGNNNTNIMNGQTGSLLFNEDETDQKYSVVAGFEYFKQKDRDKRH